MANQDLRVGFTDEAPEETRGRLIDLTLDNSVEHRSHIINLEDLTNDHDHDIELVDCDSPITLRGSDSDDDDISVIPVVDLDHSDSEDSKDSEKAVSGVRKHTLDYYHVGTTDTWLFPGADVELSDDRFLRIVSIYEIEHHGDVCLEGFLFLMTGLDRTRSAESRITNDDEDLSCLIIGQPNEIFWSIKMLDDDPREEGEQALEVFPVSDFVRLRTIKITNKEYPALNTLVARAAVSEISEDDEDDLICRWKGVKSWPDAAVRKSGTLRYCMRKLARVRAKECDPGCSAEDRSLMEKFRGRTVEGGSKVGMDNKECKRKAHEEELSRRAERLRPYRAMSSGTTIAIDTPPLPPIEIEDDPIYLTLTDDCSPIDENQDADDYWKYTSDEASTAWTETNTQRYTFGDIFCGVGGASRAAAMSGLCLQYANDIEKDMCNSYHKNFPWVKVACCDAKVFASAWAYGELKVDILHLSNPCQPFSKSHTTPGRNDEKNRNNIFLFERFLMKARPRIVTVENADGILYDKNWEYVEYLVRQLTILGYSIEFRVLRFADFGLCQPRFRFVLIAACPGQELPGYPDPTHCEPKKMAETGLPSWIGVGDAIDHIPNNWDHHDTERARRLEKPAYSRDRQCPTLITKTQSKLYHYSGRRNLTIQELSAIQSFPLYHDFGDDQSTTRKAVQIGNAVPPVPFANVYKHIVKKLLKDDNMAGESGSRQQRA